MYKFYRWLLFILSFASIKSICPRTRARNRAKRNTETKNAVSMLRIGCNDWPKIDLRITLRSAVFRVVYFIREYFWLNSDIKKLRKERYKYKNNTREFVFYENKVLKMYTKKKIDTPTLDSIVRLFSRAFINHRSNIRYPCYLPSIFRLKLVTWNPLTHDITNARFHTARRDKSRVEKLQVQSKSVPQV